MQGLAVLQQCIPAFSILSFTVLRPFVLWGNIYFMVSQATIMVSKNKVTLYWRTAIVGIANN